MKTFKAKVKTNKGVIAFEVQALDQRSAYVSASKKGKVIEIKHTWSSDFGVKMTISERAIFLERLASMIASRVGVSDALKVMVDSFGGSVKKVASTILHHVESGATLQEAFERLSSRYFPESTVAIIKTGSQGGNIASALREATTFEQELDRIKRTSSSGIYSALGGFAVGVIVLLACTLYVTPKMLNSEIVLAAKDSLNIGWVLTLSSVLTWVAGSAAVIMVLLTGLSAIRPILPSHVDRIAASIPIYKDLSMAKRNYIALYGLSVLLHAGLRIEEAFRLAMENAGRGELRNDFDRARQAVLAGRNWPSVMKTLHPTDRASLTTAQNREQIAITIKDLSIQYKRLYQQRIESFIPLLQMCSALFLSLASAVLFGVVFLPLMQVSVGLMQQM